MFTTKDRILSLVQSINTILGTSYEVENIPHYGGYSMFEETENGHPSYGYFGFYDRKTARETCNYLLGVYYALCWSAQQNAESK